MTSPQWHDLGAIEVLQRSPLSEVMIGKTRLAVTFVDGQLYRLRVVD